MNAFETLVVAAAVAVGGVLVALGMPWWLLVLVPFLVFMVWIVRDITGWPR